MDGHGLADDQAITDQLSDGLSRVRIGDFGDFAGIDPDLALASPKNRCGEALLGS